MSFLTALFRTIVGIFFGVISSLALSPALAAFHGDDNAIPTVIAWAVIAICALLGFFAPSIRRALGRGFLILGVCVFALPISTMMLSGRTISEVTSQAAQNDQAIAAAGAGIAGVAMTGAAAFIGFFAGAILLIIGLVLALGGKRDVRVVR